MLRPRYCGGGIAKQAQVSAVHQRNCTGEQEILDMLQNHEERGKRKASELD